MDPKAFFQEQDQLMNLSDDDMDEYVARMRTLRRRSQNTSRGSQKGASSTILSISANDTRNSDQNSTEVLIEVGSTQSIGMEQTSSKGSKRKGIESALIPQPKRSKITPERRPTSVQSTNDDYVLNVMSESDKAEPMASTSQSLDPASNAKVLLKRKLSGSSSRNQQALSSLKAATLPDLASQSSCAVLGASTVDQGKNSPTAAPHPDMTSTFGGKNAVGNIPSSPIEDPSSSSFTIEPKRHSARSNRLPVKQETTLLLDVQERVQRKLDAKHSIAKKQVPKVMKLPSAKEVAQDHHRSSSLGVDESSIKSVSLSSSPPAARNTSEIVDAASKKAPATATGKKSTAIVIVAPKKSSAKGKEVIPKMNVFDCTVQMQVEADAVDPATKSIKAAQFLENAHILLVSTDFRSNRISEITFKRLKLLLKHGARLVPKYEPTDLTHIIVDCCDADLRRYLQVRKLTDIPFHIPTIKWNWMANAIGMNSKKGPIILPKFFNYEACSERIGAGTDPSVFRGKGKRRKEVKRNESKDGGEEVSRISEFSSDDEIQPASSTPRSRSPQGDAARKITVVSASSSRVPLDFHVQSNDNDPLAPFYAQARAEQAEALGRHEEVDETDLSDQESEAETARDAGRPLKGWACDKKAPGQREPCVNQDIVDKLEELRELHKAKPNDHWRVYTYNKNIRAIRNHPKRIKSVSDAMKIPGVGEGTARKIMEILETGDLQRIKYERTEDVVVSSLFTGIYGVGQNIAIKWYMNGCRTLDDLRNNVGGVKLTPAQQIGLKYYDDINDRMPREEAKALFELIKPIALSIDPKLFIEIMGSYRRGKADCGDIDILITRCPDDGITHRGVLPRLLKQLHRANIITEDLAVPEDEDDLEAIYRGLCRLPHVKGSRRRRIDFLTVPWESKGGALLYYTGDDIFNRSMRLLANKKGFSLNQRGLFEGVVRDPTDRRKKLNTGNLIASKTEEEIFKKLGVPWQEPHERVRNFG